MGTRKRFTAGVVAFAAIAAGFVVTAAPASANGDLLWFRTGTDMPPTATYGANGTVRIGGKFYFKNEGCADDGVPDFVYPTSDVYIVAPGSEDGELADATGGPPNTVVQYGSIFDDEIIGITSPSGKLGEGTYDIVFDTCQDGVYQADQDALFSNVLTVRMPQGDLPAPDASLAALKQASYDEYESWKKTQRVMDGVWKLVKKALKAGCKAGNPTACALKYGNYFSPIQEQFNGLLLNQGQHYKAIYEDPPNPAYDKPVTLEPTADASALAGEAAVTQALLKAIEAYKGAQQAGDAEWALAHAREARDLNDTLATLLPATSDELQALADLYPDTADEGIVFARKYLSRIWSSGFSADERRALAENGMTRAQITAYETELRADVQPHWTAAVVRGALADTIAQHANTAAAVADSRAGWAAIADSLSSAPARPAADAGGPYDATEGTPTSLDASGSTGAASYAWDIDGDRDFDDATGAQPQVTFDEPGAPVIGVRISDADGRISYDWATVRVAAASAAPVVARTGPTDVLVRPTVSTTTTFTVDATDDTGTPEVAWAVDGQPAAVNGMSYDWTAPAGPGDHQVTATATDAEGHTASVSWDVLVRAADGDGDLWTATTDCDDADASVHPGQLEFLGNGIDDDCDAGSPDAPVGGLTGTPWAWGHAAANATGSGTNGSAYQLPQPTQLGDDVVQIEQGATAGWAVLADGSVRSWGYPTDGQLGNNTTGAAAYTPVQPTGPGGQGVLTGVRSLHESSAHVAAVRTDGTVVTWGRNNVSNLGDGSTANYRPYPDFVLTRAGGPPLTGVKSVTPGWQADYALMDDGSVMAWGYVGCDGDDGGAAPYTQFPKRIDQLDGGVRQIAGTTNIVLFLMKDGRVLSCGGTDPQLGRKWDFSEANSFYRPRQVDGLGRGSGVVDVAIAGDVATALKEDGSVVIWGENTNAGMGPVCGLDRCTLRSPTAAPMPDGAQIVDLDVKSATVLALRADGTMLTWGGNTYGAGGLGDLPGNDFVPTPTPVDVGGRHIVAIAASVWTGMALTRPADDPALPVPARDVTASIADATVSEAGDGEFTVTLSEAHSAPIEFGYVVAGDEADIVKDSGTVTVPAGSTSVAIPVDVVDDAIDEDDETFTVAITSGSLGVTIDRAQATGTITDDDAAPTVSVDSVAVGEGDTSLTDLTVHLRLSAPSGKDVTVQWHTADGTATAGPDYVAAAAEAIFPAGQTDHAVHLAVTGDTALERDETFTVDPGQTTNAVAGTGATVTVRDDEAQATSVVAPTVVEGTGGTTPATFHISVTPAPLVGESVTVPWTVVEPDAGDGDNAGDVVAAAGTVTLTADESQAPVVVQVVADDVVENPEHFALRLGDATASDGRTVLTGRSDVATIVDDDADTPPPTWPFAGFDRPVKNPPAVNMVTAGSAVPIKFGVGGDRGLDILATGYPASASHACAGGPLAAAEPAAAPGASQLTYNPRTDRYQFVWKTAKSWAGTCRQFVIKLADGSEHTAEFRFKAPCKPKPRHGLPHSAQARLPLR